VPRTGADTDLPQCDLVMKGGVTSAVVHLGAIIELGRRYRLRNIGGTSSGAIAAGLAAAAEYRRQRDGTDGLASPLADVKAQLLTPGFQAGIFQPAPAVRTLLRLMLASVHDGWGPLRRGLVVLALLLRSRWPLALAALAGWIAMTWALTRGDAATGLRVAVAVLLAGAVALLTVGACSLLLARSAKRHLDDRAHGFGICSGRTEPGERFPGLTDWLHAAIQRAAGLPLHRPLTFADLGRHQIALNVISTDLTDGAPLTWPRPQAGEYRFRAEDIRRLFPAEVADHMERCGTPSGGLLPVPGDRLPVVVAVRLSLSFPVLIASVALFAPDGRCHWCSDGGICSNFPVHLFDAWLPRRPTFGLDLEPYDGPLAFTGAGSPRDALPARLVSLLSMRGPDSARWSEAESVGVFIRQVADTAQNWRDNAQAALPGYRDRVCQIRLLPSEGGLNLNMHVDTIDTLIARGAQAGAEINREFTATRWRRHVTERYLLLMRLLQRELSATAGRYPPVRGSLRQELARTPDRGPRFARRADAATRRLLRMARRWPRPPQAVDFETRPEPRPAATMRIGPR
jgi:predicted acylesterase/phospholipase RssA